ncbi:hypothetical protein [Rhodomicrobium sp.]|uniref:hypothetical protein n=1 Tax=Rhodomicrobium sp. TaxID=2720632 RepID=UPI0039E3370A
MKSDWVKHEASYAIVEGKAITLSVAAFKYASLPSLYRGLHCGDLTTTLRGPTKLLERIKELSTEADRKAHSKLPETCAKTLYGRAGEMQKLIAAWDGGTTRLFAFDAIGGAGKTALGYHFVQGLKASG